MWWWWWVDGGWWWWVVCKPILVISLKLKSRLIIGPLLFGSLQKKTPEIYWSFTNTVLLIFWLAYAVQKWVRT